MLNWNLWFVFTEEKTPIEHKETKGNKLCVNPNVSIKLKTHNSVFLQLYEKKWRSTTLMFRLICYGCKTILMQINAIIVTALTCAKQQRLFYILCIYYRYIMQYMILCNHASGDCRDVSHCFPSKGTCLTRCDVGYEGVVCKTRW